MEHMDARLLDQNTLYIDKVAVEKGITREQALNHLVTLGGYVFDRLLEGKEFLVKDGKTINYVEWQLPPDREI